MLTLEDAINIGLNFMKEYFKDYNPEIEMELVVVTDKTVEKSFGWILFIVWDKFLETRDNNYALPHGTGPVLVKKTGEVEPLGSSPYVARWIKALRDGLTEDSFSEYYEKIIDGGKS